MEVTYNIHPICKKRLDEIVEAMNERYPLSVRAEDMTPPEAVKHYYLDGKEIFPDVYDFENYPDFKVPTYEEMVCYVVKNNWHMQFNADDYYHRCQTKGWKTKDGEPMKRWTALLDRTVSIGFCKGKTPVTSRMEIPLPVSVIKGR